MMAEETLQFNSQGLALPATFQRAAAGSSAVVMSHGLQSAKDGDRWPDLASLLHAGGTASLRFTHRGCGWGQEPRAEGHLEETTLSGRIADLRAALDFLETTGIDTARIGGVGNSFGGMVFLGARDHRVKVLVLQASPYRLPGTNSRMPALGPDAAQYDLLEAIQAYRGPILIIHGEADDTVPLEHAHRLYDAANEPKHLEIITGADHVFSGFGQGDRVLSETLEWMRTYL